MKIFRNLLDTVKPHFTDGGKLEKLHPAYDAFETFCDELAVFDLFLEIYIGF